MRSRRVFLVSLLFCLAPRASAQEAASPVGYWSGEVSWSDRRIIYSWQIDADGTFSSGRDGRGHDGGGVWRMKAGRLVLIYEDGFRYDGTLDGDRYSGSAHRANGARLGGFVMSRSSSDVGD